MLWIKSLHQYSLFTLWQYQKWQHPCIKLYQTGFSTIKIQTCSNPDCHQIHRSDSSSGLFSDVWKVHRCPCTVHHRSDKEDALCRRCHLCLLGDDAVLALVGCTAFSQMGISFDINNKCVYAKYKLINYPLNYYCSKTIYAFTSFIFPK